MVNCPRWVVYNETPCKVMSRKGDMLLIDYGYVSFGWTDARNSFTSEPSYMAVDIRNCTPITDEVAQIMRSV